MYRLSKHLAHFPFFPRKGVHTPLRVWGPAGGLFRRSGPIASLGAHHEPIDELRIGAFAGLGKA